MSVMVRMFCVLIAAALPFACMVAISIKTQESTTALRWQINQLSLKAAQSVLDRELGEFRNGLQAVASGLRLEVLGANHCDSYFRILKSGDPVLSFPPFSYLTLSAADGSVLCHGAGDITTLSGAAIRARKESLSHPGMVIGATEDGIALAWSLTSWDGRRFGTLSMDIEPAVLAQELRAVLPGDGVRLAVTAKDGTVLLTIPPDPVRVGTLLPSGWTSEQDGRLLSAPGSGANVHLLAPNPPAGLASLWPVTPANADRVPDLLLSVLAGLLLAGLVYRLLFHGGQRPASLASEQTPVAGLTGPAAALSSEPAVILAAEDGGNFNGAHWQNLLDAMPCLVWVISADGRVLLSNLAAEKAGGFSRVQFAGRPLLDGIAHHFDQEGLSRLQDAISQASEGKSCSFDASVRLGDDRRAVFELTVSPMADPRLRTALQRTARQRGRRLMITGIEVTTRSEGAQALRATEERFHAALQVARVTVFTQDLDLRYTWAHDRSLQLPYDSLVGRTDAELFPDPADHLHLTEIKRRVLSERVSVREEVRISNAGRQLYYDLSLKPLLDAAGTVIGLTGATVEVTDRKLTEAALQQAKQLAEQAVRTKSRFLAAASHDLRQPVQSLYLFTAALAERLSGHPSAPLLDNIQHSLDALKALLDSLLDIARLDEDKTPVNLTTLPLEPVLARLAAEYGPRAAEKGLSLVVVPSSRVVETDPTHLDRILRNLLENALRYTPQGKILMGVRRGTSAPGRVDLCILDTGVGIPVDRLGDIFEEFSQINAAQPGQRSKHGLGLGLAIVKRLADLMDHKISVGSAVGRGSRFTVAMSLATSNIGSLATSNSGSLAAWDKESLVTSNNEPLATSDGEAPETGPVIPPASQPVITTPDVSPVSHQALVVVVDSDAVIRVALKAMLESWEYDVMTASTATEALAMLNGCGRIPRIVLTDYHLEDGCTGSELVVSIRETLGRTVPVIVLTGDTGSDRLREAHSGGYAILHKPVHPVELRRMIGNLSGQRAKPGAKMQF